jgi:hypothetical protein
LIRIPVTDQPLQADQVLDHVVSADVLSSLCRKIEVLAGHPARERADQMLQLDRDPAIGEPDEQIKVDASTWARLQAQLGVGVLLLDQPGKGVLEVLLGVEEGPTTGQLCHQRLDFHGHILAATRGP